jgi:predicted molibdopterin-dependent oxidoreductase YjgC
LSSPLLRSGDELQPVGFQEAVAAAAARLQAVAGAHGAGAVAFLGGEKLNLEEQYLFQKLARAVVGTPHVDARTRLTARVPGNAVLLATGGGRPLLSFEALGECREVLVLSEDLQGESPLAQAVLIRGQHQRGLHVTVAHPRRVKLARPKFHGTHLAMTPGSEPALIRGLLRAALEAGVPEGLPADAARALGALPGSLAAWTPERVTQATGIAWEAFRSAAKRLREAPSRAILFGRGIVEHPQAAGLLAAIEALGWATGALAADRSSVLYLGPQHNSQGALDMGLTPDVLPGYVSPADAAARQPYEQQWGAALDLGAGLGAPEILEAAAAGRIKALWIAGDHWLRSAPDRALADRALQNCELVIVSDLFLTETASFADVVFPAAAFAEKEGVTVNAERRLQRVARALSPRRGSRADWEIFQAVAQAMGARWSYRTAEDVFREIARLVPGYEQESWATLLPLGPQWSFRARAPLPASPDVAGDVAPPAGSADGFWLLSGGTLFLQGSLSHRTPLLRQLARPRASLNPGDAARLHVEAGDEIELSGPGGRLRVAAGVDDSVPPGSVFVPYATPGVELNRLGAPRGAGLRVGVTRVRQPQRAEA